MELKEFAVEITETLQKTVVVKAESLEQAYSLVKSAYNAGDIILGAEECTDVSFGLREDFERASLSQALGKAKLAANEKQAGASQGKKAPRPERG